MNNEQLFHHFLDLLAITCSQVDQRYFSLHQSNNQTRYRERVYAYELYHLLRIGIASDERFSGLSLNGEVDKSGRPDFSNEKPDLVLHEPGSMRRNIAVIEIKRCNGTGLKEAAQNLGKFTSQYEYAGGILLIFGELEFERPQLPDKSQVMWHQHVGEVGRLVNAQQ